MAGILIDDSERSVSAPRAFCVTVQHGSEDSACRQHHVVDGELMLGSADICDLHVPDATVPPIHSIVRADAEGLSLESLTASPPVRINGEVRRAGRLQPGDRIELGSQAFTLTAVKQMPAAALPGFDEAHLTRMSCAALVEAIEREQAFVDRIESGWRAGAARLLHAVQERRADRQRTGDTLRGQLSPDAEEDLTGLMEHVCRQLDVFTREIQERAARLCRREAEFTEQAIVFAHSQQKLAERLELLARQVTNLKDRRPARKVA